jgi:hypothetical protein
MTISNASETDLLELLFNNTAFAGMGDTTGVRGSSVAGSLYVSLHTADPGETGTQLTNETSYTSYTRVAVARSGAGWTVSGASVTPAAAITFPACTGSTATITHAAIGIADTGGTGQILASGTVSPNISVSSGVTPELTTATAFTLD